jgi:O-succinylbenzoic acid--CoA ligase
VRELVAIDLPGGAAFVDALRAIWAAGDAAAPLDRRLAPRARQAQLAALRPTKVRSADGEERRLEGGEGVEDGDALVVATSGSTGDPRAVVLTREAVAASARATSARLGVDPDRHRWLACLPLAHIGGLSVVTRALCTGTALIVLNGFSAPEVEGFGRRGEATHTALVATALGRLDPAAFTAILVGGGPTPTATAPNVVATYGMTETGSGVVYDGRALPGVEVAIGDGTPGGGSAGEILLRAPMLARAYRNGPLPSVGGPDGAGWFPTGDAGRWAEGGVLEVDGRLAEVIVTGGEKVWPGAVEAVLARHRAVAEVAVWKRPDPEWGERVVAWVVPADAARPPGLSELRAHVIEDLAPWAAPKELVVCGSLPRTALGKVRRGQLA